MSRAGDHRGAVPIVSSAEETHQEWSRCEADGRPFMVVTEDGEEYHSIYDMGTVPHVLRNGSVTLIEDTFSQCPELYHDGMQEPPVFEDMAWHAGPEQGSIGPLDGYTALCVASDTAEIVLDEGNWVDVGERSSSSSSTSTATREQTR